jgi:hypothetical protein
VIAFVDQRLNVLSPSLKGKIMNRLFLVSACVLMACATTLQAQDSLSTARLEAQHKATRSMGRHLAQHEESLLKTLETSTPLVQAQVVQTIRELEQMYPTYPFKASIQPLAAKLKDESADGVVRLLSALALDELHSDAGDATIREVAASTKDKGLQVLCNALLVRSTYN